MLGAPTFLRCELKTMRTQSYVNGEWRELKVLTRNSRVAKSDLNSTEVYLATKKISTKAKMAQKLPTITQNSPKMTQKLAPAERK